MLQEVDLEAAVAQGIVTAEQAVALRALAEQRARGSATPLGHEERFQFMRSFNDFFFAIGVALLGGGLLFFTFSVPLHSLVAVIMIWLLAELLVARMRLVLPGMLLACLFVAFVILASPIDFWFAAVSQGYGFDEFRAWFTRPRLTLPQPQESIWPLMTVIAVAIGAALLFYARFRLPFSLLLVAGGFVCGALAATAYNWIQSPPWIVPTVLLSCGVIIFLAAIAFDASDPQRLTRRADNAFWLHLLAAPLIVHSLIELIGVRMPSAGNPAAITTGTALAIVAVVTLLTVVAIVIDRRALLVSTLIYLGAVIGYAITGTIGQRGADSTVIFFATLFVLGALVVVLGVGWQPVRRVLLRLLSPGVARRLPPPMQAAA